MKESGRMEVQEEEDEAGECGGEGEDGQARVEGGGASLAESVTSNSTLRRRAAASWTCVLRSLDYWRESLTCGLLPNNTLPALVELGLTP